MPTMIPNGYQRRKDSERRPAEGSQPVGPADPQERMSITIVVARRGEKQISSSNFQ
jgi:hypothetical protein